MKTSELRRRIAEQLRAHNEFAMYVTRDTMRGKDRLRFRVAPHTNSSIHRLVYEVTELERPGGGRSFDSAVNKTYDSERQFIAALLSRLP